MIRTKIDFVAGFDPMCLVPELVRSVGLRCRIAVIQDTYRPDSVDMYFDQPLWLCLLEFATQFGHGLQVGIVDRRKRAPREPERADEVPPEAFLAAWRALDDADRYPPACIVVRDRENLVLYISTEYWNRAGGPMPYHDSYTYSIFSNEDLAAKVIQFLADAEASRGWELSTNLLQPNPGNMRLSNRVKNVVRHLFGLSARYPN